MSGDTRLELEAEQTLAALELHNGIITRAARALSISRSTLTSAIERLGLSEDLARIRSGAKRPAVVTDIPEEVSREEMLDQELREAKAQLRKNRREDVREERVIHLLSEIVPEKKPRYRPAIFTPGARNPHTLVLLWSDLHAAEVVSLEETNGANEYNWSIMLERHDQLRRGVLSFRDQFAPCEELVILGLGDMLSGNIHDELAESNEMPLAEATVQLGLDGAEFIESFVDEFPKIRFAGVVGNHPRPHRKPRAKGKYDNADWTAYQIMAQRLRGHDSVTFEIPKAQKHPVEVYGKRILCTHGDGIRSTMVDVPWGGIIRLTNKLRNQYAGLGMPIDHFAMGHYHEPNVVKNRRILMNGSVKGVDEYSMEAFGGGEPPSQILAPFHRKHGMVCGAYIDLDPKAEAKAA